MRQDLERLLRDTTLVTLAFAIALGWSLYQLAASSAGFITTAMQDTSDSDFPSDFPSFSLHWGDHVFYFLPLLQALIQFVVVLAVVLIVRRRLRTT
jgi:hypothetical protein